VNLKVNTPVAIILGADRPVCGDSGIILSGPAPDSIVSYLWTVTDITGPPIKSSFQTIEISKTAGTQRVSLEIVDIHGCINTDSVKILECSNVLGINNTITPNGDGRNDFWKINNIEVYPYATISLYDRWGRLVYSKNGNYQNTDADGFKGIGPNGSLLPMDSYFYVIDLKNGSKPITGYLLIIK
jgi:gliding motility-associated-like protein